MNVMKGDNRISDFERAFWSQIVVQLKLLKYYDWLSSSAWEFYIKNSSVPVVDMAMMALYLAKLSNLAIAGFVTVSHVI